MNYSYVLQHFEPSSFHYCNTNVDEIGDYHKRKTDNSEKEKSHLFWKYYYSNQDYKFKKNDIKIYDNVIPYNIMEKIDVFIKIFPWFYGYKNNKITTLLNYNSENNDIENEVSQCEENVNEDQFEINEEILKNNELECFYGNVMKNDYFEAIFYSIILPQIDVENKENISIDRAFLVGRLHNLSE